MDGFVKSSRFYRYEHDILGQQGVIEIHAKNVLDEAVSEVAFRAVVSTPGRTVPWLTDSFTYEIDGGLEPGEEVTWELMPPMLGDWDELPEDRNLVLTMKTTRAVKASGETIEGDFTPEDADRLSTLREQADAL